MRAVLPVLWMTLLMLLVAAARPPGFDSISRPEAAVHPGFARMASTGVPLNPSATPTCDECAIGATRAAALATTISGGLQSAQRPAVRAVMFWREGCPHCHEVIDDVLPAIQGNYGEQLEVLLIEVLTPDDVELLIAAAAAYRVPDGSVGVPFLVIGDRALVGSWAISSELPGLIDRFLAEGGVDYPEIPGLSARLPSQPRPVQADVSLAGPAQAEGFGLAITVLVGMGTGLVYALVRWVRAMRNRSTPASITGWNRWGIVLLAALGMGVAGYLGFVEAFNADPVCGPVGDCLAVQHSPYARMLGVIPVSALGLIGYIAILSIGLWGLGGSVRRQLLAGRMVFYLSIVGVVFSLYLTFLEPFVIGAVCVWCLTSAVSITGVMLLSLPRASRRGRLRPGAAATA